MRAMINSRFCQLGASHLCQVETLYDIELTTDLIGKTKCRPQRNKLCARAIRSTE